MGAPIVVGNSEATRRRVLTGAASALFGAVLPRPVLSAELLPPRVTTTVGMGRIPVQQKETFVFAVTNRPATGSTDLSNQFGIGRAHVHGGCLKILVTTDRNQRSSVPSRVASLRTMPFKEMAAVANRRLPRRTAIVLVPGYNNSYNDAVIAAGQIKLDIQTHSSIFVVAWNSQGSSLGYLRDADETWFTENLVRNLLLDLFRSGEFSSIQIIGHSMGARAVVAALGNILRSQDAKLMTKISRVILAAPDVDVDVFNADYIPVAEHHGFDTALYVSSKDLMMRISEFWSARPRVGGAWSTIYINPRVDTIDVSAVDETTLGHSTIFQSNRLANDMHYFLEKGVPAQTRFQLHQVSIQGGTYWKMSP